MRKSLGNLGLARISSGLVAGLLLCAVTAMAQEPPLVYTQENTGAGRYPAPVFPAFAQLPIVRQLPDPFVFSNGVRDTRWSAQEHHRQEYLAALEKYEVGPKPTCTGTSADDVLGVTYRCSETASFAFSSGSTTSGTLTINVTVVGPTGSHTLTATAPIVLPTVSAACPQPAAGWPIIIGMTGPTGSWPASAFNASIASPTGVTVPAAGCAATVSFGGFFGPGAYSAFGAYDGGSTAIHNNDGFYQLYPTLCEGSTSPSTTAGTCNSANGFPNGSNSGEYAVWAYGLSRIVDGLEMIASQSANPIPLDIAHSATTGCSYAGKMAMWTAALDERIALSIAQENGGGGEPSWRISHEIETQGSVEDINDTSYSWFDTAQLQFSGFNAYKMPTDHFELMALMAPRALLTTGDGEYYWLGDRSGTLDDLATEAIYKNYGIGDRFNWYIDTNHFHCVVPSYQQNATQPIINRFLFGANVPTDVKVSWQEADALPRREGRHSRPLQHDAQPTWDPNMWTGWWGTGRPAFPVGDVWNEGGDVMLPLNQMPGAWNPSLTIATGDTVTSQYQLSMPGTHAAATVTVPTSYTEIDVACRDGSSYTFSVPPPQPSTSAAGYPPISGSPSAAANSQTFTIAANNNAVFPSAVASTTNPGCDDGKPGTVIGSYFFALGIPSPGAGNPGLTGFSTTDGVQGAATTDPLNVSFNIGDSNTHRVDWSPTTTINRENPYSCTPPGCPLTPIITWVEPAPITFGTALGSDQLDAAASAMEISGMAGGAPDNTGLLTNVSVPGTWVYSPPAGTVLPPGHYTLRATFTPTNIYTASTPASTAYETYTAATASVPIIVTPPPPHHHGDDGQH